MTDRSSGPTILLFGAAGQVGSALVRTLTPVGQLHPLTRSDVSLLDPSGLRATVRDVEPDIIVNAAAYTQVDAAEQEPEIAHAVNATAPAVLAEEAARIGARLVHYSTDYVFDGTQRTPYRETDAPAPLNVYGMTKLAGEDAVRESGCSYVILRTSWVYGATGRNFVRSILRKAREPGATLRVVDDQIGAPTSSRLIADVTARIVAAGGSGTYHLTAGGATTWYAFALAIMAADPAKHEQRVATVQPIATADYPTAARRPMYSVLDTTRLRETFGLTLPDWLDDVGPAVAAITLDQP